MEHPLLANEEDEDELPPSPLQRFLLDDDLSSLTANAKKLSSEVITIYIKCVFPDPQKPGEMIQRMGSQTCSANDRVERVVTEFLSTYRDIPQNKTYYLGYDQLLFRTGTLRECGITHGKSVELYAPGKNHAAYTNQGLQFMVWSCIPIVIGIACLLFSMMSTDSSIADMSDYQALFLFLGFLILTPSALIFILGMILVPGCNMPCYFSGTEWC